MSRTERDPCPIVFIAGLFNVFPTEQAREWFAPRVVLSPDLLGYGAFAGHPPGRITMEAQADHVAALTRGAGIASAHFVGQSVGGVIAFLIAQRHPGLVRSVISVEGNFTLGDAFWSRRLAVMDEEGVTREVQALRSDPAAWLRKSGIDATAGNLKIAREALLVPPLALQAMARGVVEATEGDRFVDIVGALLDRGLPVRLLAGERSREGWNVPDSIARRADGVCVQPGVGHLMMLEAPPEYFRLVADLADGVPLRP